MYHSTYLAPCFVGNQIPKSPLIFTYGDVSFLTLDHLSTFLPFTPQQISSLPVAFDVSNMKRIPVNLLMQNVDSTCYLPLLQKPCNTIRKPNQMNLERHFSKESLIDSSYSGDSGVASSRSSTPSSVETSSSNELKDISPSSENSKNSKKKPRKSFAQKNFVQGQNAQRNLLPSNQKHPVGIRKGNLPFSIGSPSQIAADEWYLVSKSIWEYYIKNKQKDDMYWKKMSLRTAVHSLLEPLFPHCYLSVVGSSVNGLGTNNSDVDMCLILSPLEIDQQTEAMFILKYAQKLLSQCSFVKSTELITAKVPILKFIDKYDIQVDLNVNNTVGIENTQLLRAYSDLDWRVPPLVLIIKKWAHDWNINNAKEMTLSSYSLVLMVIHYLQCGCQPPVLPSLQKLRPRRFDLNMWKWPHPHVDSFTYWSKNSQSLGSLLYGFFEYFITNFDFDKDVMSVRLGCKLPKAVAMNFKSPKNKRGHWKYICIEEPFNRTNTACAVYDEDSFHRILSAFKNTWLQLADKKNLSVILKS